MDGVCCDASCKSSCYACNLPAKSGVCSAVPANSVDKSATASCSGTNACDGKGGCKSAPGVSCAKDGECASGFCTDGVCCDTRCDKTCLSCALKASIGTCSAIPANTDPIKECPSSYTCDGQGKCRKKDGVTCSLYQECVSGFCVDGYCCASACLGACQTCGLPVKPGVCALMPAGKPDSQAAAPCTGTKVCNGKGQCKLAAGRACLYNTECGHGYCTDGVCCRMSCGEACWACHLSGLLGTCSPSPAMKPDKVALVSCDNIKACDGKGNCGLVNGQGCTSDSQCASGHCVDFYCCDGTCAGACQACNLPGLLGSCSPVAAGDPDPQALLPCTGTQACDGAGACKLARGQACTSDSLCASDHCADGVCCDTACTKTCMSCALSGALGTCTYIPANSNPDKECLGTDIKCGGQCNGQGQCDFPGLGTACGAGSCKACDGTGSCNRTPLDDATCGGIDCDKLDSTCRDYHDLEAGRCAGFGKCKDSNDAKSCTRYTDLACAEAGSDTGGVDSGGADLQLVMPDPVQNGCGCEVGHGPHGAETLWIIFVLGVAFVVRKRALEVG